MLSADVLHRLYGLFFSKLQRYKDASLSRRASLSSTREEELGFSATEQLPRGSKMENRDSCRFSASLKRTLLLRQQPPDELTTAVQPSALLSRVHAFLPQIHAANTALGASEEGVDHGMDIKIERHQPAACLRPRDPERVSLPTKRRRVVDEQGETVDATVVSHVAESVLFPGQFAPVEGGSNAADDVETDLQENDSTVVMNLYVDNSLGELVAREDEPHADRPLIVEVEQGPSA